MTDTCVVFALGLSTFLRYFLERRCEKFTILPFAVIKVYSQNLNFEFMVAWGAFEQQVLAALW